MEFLKNCTTNAQAIVRLSLSTWLASLLTFDKGDFEAVVYQAFSVTRLVDSSTTGSRDWNASDNIRAVEANLWRALHLVAQDATRPWLWLFKPTSVEQASQDALELPETEGFRLQRRITATLSKLAANMC